ncbi:MAG TPA: hypothetical protein VIF62_07700 [Labilithrix sp.]
MGCGGGVSLGQTGQGQDGTDGGTGGSSGSSGASSGGVGTGVKECSSPAACGPMPGAPTTMPCADGSAPGFTGKCVDLGDGKCVWETTTCPPDACFSKGELEPQYKKCTTAADCTTIQYSQSCCGSPHVTGVATASLGDVKMCIANEPPQPACACPSGPPIADDGSMPSSAGGGSATPIVYCNASMQCETTYKKGITCGSNTCAPTQFCCSGTPGPATPTCSNGPCPVSRRAYKKDISYLADDDRERLTDELYSFRLATYRYKSEASSSPTHLGFMIDDVAPSPAVTQKNGDSVDLYGYTTMAVAALQTQARELAELRREVDELKKSCKR